jgi:hypothetical protein
MNIANGMVRRENVVVDGRKKLGDPPPGIWHPDF